MYSSFRVQVKNKHKENYSKTSYLDARDACFLSLANLVHDEQSLRLVYAYRLDYNLNYVSSTVLTNQIIKNFIT
jgi:hypothetical protein